MKVFKNLAEVDVLNTIATIGFFDGVHIGHSQLLKLVVERTKKLNTSSLVITFWPHPRTVLQKESSDLRLLTSLDEKIDFIKRLGIDSLLVMEFNRTLADVAAPEFINSVLVEKLRINSILVGYNHNFGKNGTGNFNLLEQFSTQGGYTAELVNSISIEGVNVSSSKIRSALERGNLSFANQMLGRHYQIIGTIEGGKQIGRAIGFPTANIVPSEPYKQIPGYGVYAVWFDFKGESYPAMLNIGVKPTFGTNLDRTIEAHIIGFNQNIYNEEIRVRFVEKIRNEMRFPSVDALKSQLSSDKDHALSILGQSK